jgi:CubicO group peptidase (beta-lactamase class C family)
MKNFFLLIVALALFACGTNDNKDNSSSNANISQVEKSLIADVYFEGDSTWTIEERMKHYGVPGVSIAVINNGKIEWTNAYGIMDKETNEPVTTLTLFQAGSISKPVAAYGALKTVEMGKANLHEDVNNFLTSWKVPQNDFTKQNQVNLTHLLSHTAGLTVHGFPGYTPGDPLPTTVQILDGVSPANTGPVRVDKLPGLDFRYSGGGYTVMQQMLVDVHGISFPALEKELVFDPIGMTNSTYDQPLDSVWVKKAATGYLPDHTQTSGKRHTYPEMAAAGLWTTAEDLAKFAVDVQQTLKGESTKVLSKSMAEQMVKPVFPNGFIGLGLFLNDFGGDKYFGHGGWDEGFSSEMIAHTTKGNGVVVLTNSNHPAFIAEVMRAVAKVYNWENYVRTYKKQAHDTTIFKSIVGRYRNGSDGAVAISSEDGKLYFKYLRAENRSELYRISETQYISRDNNTPIEFKKNADGVTEIVMWQDGKPSERKRPIMKDDERVPYEHLLAGDFNKALKAYQQIMKDNPKDDAVAEDNLNENGYDLLHNGKGKLSQDIFKINTILYPNSSNVYDSYAEACMKNGDPKEAIKNYKKSLELNPNNENAKKQLAELTKK